MIYSFYFFFTKLYASVLLIGSAYHICSRFLFSLTLLWAGWPVCSYSRPPFIHVNEAEAFRFKEGPNNINGRETLSSRGGLEDVAAKQPNTFNGMLPLNERVETAISKARKAAIVMSRLGNISGWQQ